MTSALIVVDPPAGRELVHASCDAESALRELRPKPRYFEPFAERWRAFHGVRAEEARSPDEGCLATT